jgi:uncharacterized membrane protein
MANKFDTNPLDPEFPKRVAEMQQAETASNISNETRTFANNEDATRRFDNTKFQGMFETANYQPPALYQTSKLAETAVEKPTSRKVAKVGLPENALLILSYCPFQIGLFASFLQLLFVPKSETKVRFHAAQGFALHLAILIIGAILGIISGFFGFAGFVNGIFPVASMILLIISMVKVWKGKPVHFEPIEEFTDVLSEKVTLDFFKKLFGIKK